MRVIVQPGVFDAAALMQGFGAGAGAGATDRPIPGKIVGMI